MGCQEHGYPVNIVPERQQRRYTRHRWLMMQTFLRGAAALGFFPVSTAACQSPRWVYISTHFCCMRCTILSYHTTIAMVPHSFRAGSLAARLTLLSLGFHEPNYPAAIFSPFRFPLSVLVKFTFGQSGRVYFHQNVILLHPALLG